MAIGGGWRGWGVWKGLLGKMAGTGELARGPGRHSGASGQGGCPVVGTQVENCHVASPVSARALCPWLCHGRTGAGRRCALWSGIAGPGPRANEDPDPGFRKPRSGLGAAPAPRALPGLDMKFEHSRAGKRGSFNARREMHRGGGDRLLWGTLRGAKERRGCDAVWRVCGNKFHPGGDARKTV